MSEMRKLRLGDGDNVREYALHPMPPLRAVHFIPKVTKALSPVLLADGDIKSLTSGQADVGAAAKLVLGGLSKVNPDDLTELAKEALSYECYAGPSKLGDNNGFTTHFDDWFRKYPQDMLQVMGWAIWENCKDFFPGGSEILDSLASRVQEKVQSPSQKDGSQNTTSDAS